MYAQGYFVYDSHKSGAQTISHLRFGKQPIRAPYLIESANFVACHQADFLERIDVLRLAGQRRRRSCSTPRMGPTTVWDQLPRSVQRQILDKTAALLRDRRVQGRARCGPRRADQHGAADLLLRDLRRAAARGGDPTHQALDREDATATRAPTSCAGISRPSTTRWRTSTRSRVPEAVTSALRPPADRPDEAPPFVREVTAQMMAGPRRRAPRQPDAGRRHLPIGHRSVREAQHLRHRRGVGSRSVHPVRPMRLRLSAQRHPREILPREGARRRARRLQVGADQCARQSRTSASRCSSTSRTAPAAASASRSARRTARATRA